MLCRSGRTVLTLESVLSFAEVWVFKTPDSLYFSGVWGLSFPHSSFCNTPRSLPQSYQSGQTQHFCLIYCINYALPMENIKFCLQINRNSLFSFFLESSSRLTPHMLKGRTGEFDLESISFLDLSGMGRNKVLIFHNYWMWIFKIHKLKCTVQILVLAISALFSTSQIDSNFPWSILLDHSNDIKMFQTQVKPRATGKRFHCKVFNILTSVLWAIGVQTLENSCWIVFSGLLIFRGKKAKFCGIFRVKFAEKSADFAGFSREKSKNLLKNRSISRDFHGRKFKICRKIGRFRGIFAGKK